jgi:hypothetical protein
MAKVLWKIHGMPASTQTCAAIPELYVSFYGSGDMFGFSPVPCDAGQFTIDKLPNRFVEAEVGVGTRPLASGPFDATGAASFDLNP